MEVPLTVGFARRQWSLPPLHEGAWTPTALVDRMMSRDVVPAGED